MKKDESIVRFLGARNLLFLRFSINTKKGRAIIKYKGIFRSYGIPIPSRRIAKIRIKKKTIVEGIRIV